MGISSINIQPVKSGSESHNLRKKELDYVKKDLTHLNANYGFDKKLSEVRKEIDDLYQAKVGQKMQKKAAPLREGVFLFEEKHTNDDIINAVKAIEKRFKIKPIQLSIHRDEGHYEKHTNVWKPNLHAHVVFDFQDKETGKTIKLNRQDLSEMQTLLAHMLQMERGKSSSKKHLSALEFKNKKAKEALDKQKKVLQEQDKRFRKNSKITKDAMVLNKMKEDPMLKKLISKIEIEIGVSNTKQKKL